MNSTNYISEPTSTCLHSTLTKKFHGVKEERTDYTNLEHRLTPHFPLQWVFIMAGIDYRLSFLIKGSRDA